MQRRLDAHVIQITHDSIIVTHLFKTTLQIIILQKVVNHIPEALHSVLEPLNLGPQFRVLTYLLTIASCRGEGERETVYRKRFEGEVV